jgi:hypothetical protein
MSHECQPGRHVTLTFTGIEFACCPLAAGQPSTEPPVFERAIAGAESARAYKESNADAI